MTPANIQSGFEVTGIYPFNRHRIPDDIFVPSSVTDRPNSTSQDLTEQLPIEGESSVSVSVCSVSRPDAESHSEVGIILEALSQPPGDQLLASSSEIISATRLNDCEYVWYEINLFACHSSIA